MCIRDRQYGAEIWKLSLLFNERKYCMEGPIVSIDVSNGNSHYMCFIKNNKRFGKVKKIDHDIEGFKRLLEDWYYVKKKDS